MEFNGRCLRRNTTCTHLPHKEEIQLDLCKALRPFKRFLKVNILIRALYLSPPHHDKQMVCTILHTCKTPKAKMQFKSGEILSNMDLDETKKK